MPTAYEGLSDTQIQNIHEMSDALFNIVDRNGDESISKEELGELMETLGIDATPEEIDLMIAEIDEDNNGVIDFDEFVAVMSRKVSATYPAEQVRGAFRVFESGAPPGHIILDACSIRTYACSYWRRRAY